MYCLREINYYKFILYYVTKVFIQNIDDVCDAWAETEPSGVVCPLKRLLKFTVGPVQLNDHFSNHKQEEEVRELLQKVKVTSARNGQFPEFIELMNRLSGTPFDNSYAKPKVHLPYAGGLPSVKSTDSCIGLNNALKTLLCPSPGKQDSEDASLYSKLTVMLGKAASPEIQLLESRAKSLGDQLAELKPPNFGSVNKQPALIREIGLICAQLRMLDPIAQQLGLNRPQLPSECAP